MNVCLTFLISALLAGEAPQDAKKDAAAKKPAAGKPAEPNSLDDDLFQDLTDKVFEGLGDVPELGPAKTGESKPAEKAEKKAGEDEPLDQQPGQGEDLGQESDPLIELGRRMREVEEMLAKAKADGKTQRLQTQIVADLELLIELIRQQQKQASKSSASGKQRGIVSRKKLKLAGGPQQGGNNPSQENPNPRGSDNSLRKTKQVDPDRDPVLSMEKRVWGHLLPLEVQEAIANAQSAKFVYEYAEEVKGYFARLAEMYEKSNVPR